MLTLVRRAGAFFLALVDLDLRDQVDVGLRDQPWPTTRLLHQRVVSPRLPISFSTGETQSTILGGVDDVRRDETLDTTRRVINCPAPALTVSGVSSGCGVVDTRDERTLSPFLL